MNSQIITLQRIIVELEMDGHWFLADYFKRLLCEIAGRGVVK